MMWCDISTLFLKPNDKSIVLVKCTVGAHLKVVMCAVHKSGGEGSQVMRKKISFSATTVSATHASCPEHTTTNWQHAFYDASPLIKPTMNLSTSFLHINNRKKQRILCVGIFFFFFWGVACAVTWVGSSEYSLVEGFQNFSICVPCAE